MKIIKSKGEIKEEFDSLSDRELERLQLRANARAQGSRLSGEDLLHQAFLDVLGGNRKWPEKLAIIPFISQIMRSIVSNDRKKSCKEDAIDDHLEFSNVESMTSSTEKNAEDAIIEKQESKLLKKKIFNILGDDEKIKDIFECKYLMEMSPSETKELLNITDNEYNSGLKQIRRKLNEGFKKGEDNE